MEKMGIFISMYLVLGLAVVVGAVLVNNRDNGASSGASKKNVA